MSGLPDFEAQAQRYIVDVCRQRGCVYAGSNFTSGEPDCKVKYSDEVVRDFETDGCSAAALQAVEGVGVIPVTIIGSGQVALTKLQILKSEHRQQLVRVSHSEGGQKTVFQAVK